MAIDESGVIAIEQLPFERGSREPHFHWGLALTEEGDGSGTFVFTVNRPGADVLLRWDGLTVAHESTAAKGLNVVMRNVRTGQPGQNEQVWGEDLAAAVDSASIRSARTVAPIHKYVRTGQLDGEWFIKCNVENANTVEAFFSVWGVGWYMSELHRLEQRPTVR